MGLDSFYECEHCDEVCESKTELENHKCDVNCVPSLPYRCSVCEKRFSGASAIKNHMRSHGDVVSEDSILGWYTVDNVFTCGICNISFISQDKLDTHSVLKHSSEKFPYVCKDCGKGFALKSSLHSHVRTHGEKKHACDVCDKAYRNVSELSRHQQRKHSNAVKSFKCEVCENMFHTSYELKLHMERHQVDVEYKCHICDKSFYAKQNLRSHLLIHTREKTHVCNICCHAFLKKADLIRHVRKHTGEKPFKCDTCSKAFTTQESLTHHKRTHTDTRLYKCNECSKSFNHKDRLQIHMWKHTGVKEHKCDRCQRVFSRLDGLKKHQESHCGESTKKFQCDVCQRFLADQCSLNRHKKIHTKPYSCTVCDKKFSTKQELDAHMKYHTGDLFKCEFCGKGFNYKNSLKLHVRTHTKEKPYHCEFCDMTFSSSGALKYHTRTHTGEKPYKCHLCSFASAQPTDRKKHLLTHEKVNYSCSYCGRKFRKKNLYEQHEQYRLQHDGSCPKLKKKRKSLHKKADSFSDLRKCDKDMKKKPHEKLDKMSCEKASVVYDNQTNSDIMNERRQTAKNTDENSLQIQLKQNITGYAGERRPLSARNESTEDTNQNVGRVMNDCEKTSTIDYNAASLEAESTDCSMLLPLAATKSKLGKSRFVLKPLRIKLQRLDIQLPSKNECKVLYNSPTIKSEWDGIKSDQESLDVFENHSSKTDENESKPLQFDILQNKIDVKVENVIKKETVTCKEEVKEDPGYEENSITMNTSMPLKSGKLPNPTIGASKNVLKEDPGFEQNSNTMNTSMPIKSGKLPNPTIEVSKNIFDAFDIFPQTSENSIIDQVDDKTSVMRIKVEPPL